MTIRKLILVPVFVILSLALLAAAGVFAFFMALDREFDVAAPDPGFDPPESIAEARLQDVAYLETFLELERSWTPETRAAADRLHDRLRETASAMSDAEFDLAVAEIVASADNAHTKVREYDRLERYSRLPIRFHIFEDGLFVVRAYQGYEGLIGARVDRIGSASAEEALEIVEHYIGGPEGTERKYAPYILESPELLHAAGISSNADGVVIDFTMADGEMRPVHFAHPYPPNTDQAIRSVQLLSPIAFSQSQPEWAAALRGRGELPLYLQSVIEQVNVSALPDIDGVYIQYWTNSSGSADLSAFHREARALIQETNPSVIVLDQRFNLGGNYMNTASFMEWLGQALPADGRLYIVTAGTTFSAGISSTARALQAAADRTILIGEPVGDRLQFWSEDNLLVLPNSGIQIKFSTGYHDLTERCLWFRDCFWIDMFYPLAIDDLDPDIHVPLISVNYFAGQDPVLDRIRELESQNIARASAD